MSTEPQFNLETFLLTALSRITEISGAVIVLRDQQGRTTIHKCNISGEWIDLVGPLEATKHDILTNHIMWNTTTAAGEILSPEEPQDDH